MSARAVTTNSDLTPPRGEVTPWAAVYGLGAGPLAWYLQLCIAYPLATWPCFPDDRRRELPLRAFAWSGPAVIGLEVLCLTVALAAVLVAYRTFRVARDQADERSAFVGLWGMLLAAGFSLAIAFNSIALAVLPRCAG